MSHYKHISSQDELKYLYDSARARMKPDPDLIEMASKIIEKQKAIIQGQTFMTEKEALETAVTEVKKSRHYLGYQIWAKIEKAGDIYRLQEGGWIASCDGRVCFAAEFMGMDQVYDAPKIARICSDNVKIDDLVAYW